MRKERADDRAKRRLTTAIRAILRWLPLVENRGMHSGRPLAGQGQGQKQSVANELRHYDARRLATFIFLQILTAPAFSLCRLRPNRTRHPSGSSLPRCSASALV